MSITNKVIRRNFSFHIFEYGVIFILSTFLALTTFESTSPLFAKNGSDSVIFKSMGMGLLTGKVPYIDYFDHKGPILYYINALGQIIIPGNLGIFLLELISSFFVLVCLYKTTKLLSSSRYIPWISLIVGWLLYWITGVGGNTCEEWELLAIAPLLYLVFTFFPNPEQRLSAFKLGILLGAGFSFCFFIRPNDAVSQVGGLSISLALFLFFNKRFSQLGKFVGGLAIGTVVISLIATSFFIAKSATGDLFYGLIGHNLKYAGNFLGSLMLPQKIWMFIFIMICVALLYKKENRHILLLILPSLLLGLFLLGERMYEHYFVIFIPAIVLITTVIVGDFKWWKSLAYILSLLFFVSISIKDLSAIAWRIRYDMGAYGLITNRESLEKSFQQQGTKIITSVPLAERDSIWNYNLSFNKFIYTGIFWENGIMQMNRIPFYEMAFVDPMLAESDKIEEKNPLWVTLTHENDNLCEAAGKEVGRLFDYFQAGYDYIEANYDRVARTDTTICDIELWRRRDVIDKVHMDEVL